MDASEQLQQPQQYLHDDLDSSNANGDWKTPLLFSLLAGSSTSLGAAAVFCLQRKKNSRHHHRYNDDGMNDSSESSKRTKIERHREREESAIGPGFMSFSLALAGSVMVTVSFVSILPETFLQEDESTAATKSFVPITSLAFWERSTSLALGCSLYLLLSKCAFPEPEAILRLEEKSKNNNRDDDDDDERNLSGRLLSSHSLPPAPSTPSSSETGIRFRRNYDVEQQTFQIEKKNIGRNHCFGFNNIHRIRKYFSGSDLSSTEERRAWRVVMLLFVSLTAHNFPEGLAVAASTMHSKHLGLTTTLAIALHNIPEGIAISIPCLAARPESPWLAFGLASLSGLAEPFGAAVALYFLRDVEHNNNQNIDSHSLLSMTNILAFVAGIMVMVAVSELLPEAARHTQNGWGALVAGVVIGAVVMIVTEFYLE